MISIFLRTVIIYLLLAISLKIMGKRQIGELEVGELVSTLLISEIVSIPIDTPDIPLLNAVIPLLFILSVEIIMSHIKNKSKKIKNAIEGKPSFIIYNGKLRQTELLQNRISINEILTEMRAQGIPSIADVSFCILEPGGKLSFFENGTALSLPIVIDGETEDENIALLGVDIKEVNVMLGQEGQTVSDVFLMTADQTGSYNIIYKEENQ